MYEYPQLQYILWALGVLPLVYLFQIYREREQEEPGLALKLIGYLLLGGFTLRIQAFAIPLGYLVYKLSFRPRMNTRVKHRAARVGLLVYISLFLYHMLPEEHAANRWVEVPSTPASNVFATQWELWGREAVKKLPSGGEANLTYFNLSFDRTGSLQELHWSAIPERGSRYEVSWSPVQHNSMLLFSQVYSKDPSKPSTFGRSDAHSSLPIGKMFSRLSNLPLEEVLPEGEFERYHFTLVRGLESGLIKAEEDPKQIAYVLEGTTLERLQPGEERILRDYIQVFLHANSGSAGAVRSSPSIRLYLLGEADSRTPYSARTAP